MVVTGVFNFCDTPPLVPRKHRYMNVVVVEDNEDIRETLVQLLGLMGHTVCAAAADGPSGVAAVLREHPHLALVDIGLPGIDGYELARQVREACGHSVWLLATTGYCQPEERRRAFDAGFDLHLAKPVEAHALETILATLAARHPGDATVCTQLARMSWPSSRVAAAF